MFNNIILSGMAWTASVAGGIIAKLKEEHGQDLVEYAVIIGAIAMVAAVALFAFDWDASITTFATEVSDCITFDDTCGAN